MTIPRHRADTDKDIELFEYKLKYINKKQKIHLLQGKLYELPIQPVLKL